MKSKIPILFTAFAVASCSQPAALTESEQNNIIKNVSHTLESYYRDVKENGLTAELSYLDDSKDFFWVPPGYQSAISYDSVAAILKQNAPRYKTVDNGFDTLRIIPLSLELATYTGRLHSTMTDSAGKTMSFYLLETGVLINRNGVWKLLHGQTAVINK